MAGAGAAGAFVAPWAMRPAGTRTLSSASGWTIRIDTPSWVWGDGALFLPSISLRCQVARQDADAGPFPLATRHAHINEVNRDPGEPTGAFARRQASEHQPRLVESG